VLDNFVVFAREGSFGGALASVAVVPVLVGRLAGRIVPRFADLQSFEGLNVRI
jgi:hypothetical protein